MVEKRQKNAEESAKNRKKCQKTLDFPNSACYNGDNQEEGYAFYAYRLLSKNVLEETPMNKPELIAAVAAKAGLSKKDAEKAVAGVLESITASLAKGDKVALIGFGTFEVKARAARTGKNPQTGAAIKIAATKVPAFKAGKALKDAVNK